MKFQNLLFTLIGLAFSMASGFATSAAQVPLDHENFTIIVVSPEGNDRNLGTQEEPLATLEGARNRIRILRQEGSLPDKPIIVLLREGDYILENSFRLHPRDSGTSDQPVVFMAFPRETPRIMGGYRLNPEDFRPISDPEVKARIIDRQAAQRILEFDLKSKGITGFGEISRRGFYMAGDLSKTPPMHLFINGSPQQLARWPNDSTVRMGEILDPGPLDIPEERPAGGNFIRAELNPVYAKMIGHLTDNATEGRIPAPSLEWTRNVPDFHERGGIFRFDYDRPLKWADSDDIWIAGIFGFSWAWSYNRVARIDREERRIELAHGETYGIQKNWFDDFHHFENILEEIDQPGEYYIDRQRGILYFYPGYDWNANTEVLVSSADFPLWAMQGVEHIHLDGLSFVGGRTDAIHVHNGRHVTLNNLHIHSFAGTAVTVRRGSHVTIDNAHIHDIGSTGVILVGGDWETLEPSGHKITNSRVHDIAYFDQVYNPAVSLDADSVGTVVRGNTFFDIPHIAITIRGNDHLIENNEFFRIGRFSDMGAIYGNLGERPSQRGHVIRGNFFHNIGHEKTHFYAVYPDNQTMGWLIENNVFFNMGLNNSAINVNSGSYIIVRNNLFVDVPLAIRHSFHSFGAHDYSGIWKSYFERFNFAEMVHGERYPELLVFFEEPRNPSESNTFVGNIIYNPNKELLGENGVEHANIDLLISRDNLVLRPNNGLVRVVNGRLIINDPVRLSQRVPGFPVISLPSRD